jgi:uncharacterized protein
MKKQIMAAALMLAATTQIAFAQQPDGKRDPRVLTVMGTGTIMKQPDRAVVIVAVESRATTAQTAAQANARKMEAVYAALRGLQIMPPKVQTISYELQPQYSQPTERTQGEYVPRIIGYVAMNMVRVELDSVPRVGNVIDAVIAAGANRIANLSFELRDPESVRLEALKIAVQKARAEAEIIAAAAGQRLGSPLSINSSSNWGPQPMYRTRNVEMQMSAPAAAPTPVEAGNLSVMATVNINYELLDR